MKTARDNGVGNEDNGITLSTHAPQQQQVHNTIHYHSYNDPALHEQQYMGKTETPSIHNRETLVYPPYQADISDYNGETEHQYNMQVIDSPQPGYYDDYRGNYHHPHLYPNSTPSTTTCLTRLFRALLSNEALHRSFCFGAIDGLLTGSGIAAASAGLGIFDPYSHLFQYRILPVLLCLAACTADALCMSIGHVWSTYVIAQSQDTQRRREEILFRTCRGESKARLVDMLLMRGMLKIDAMSVADTLEGYPDIFLGFLQGNQQPQNTHGLGLSSRGSSADDNDVDNDNNNASNRYNSSIGHHLQPEQLHLIESIVREEQCGFFGCCTPVDPQIITESRNEGIVMMFAFALFSILPSIVYAFLPAYINTSTVRGQKPYRAVNELTITIVFNSFVMLFLGIWKSKFFSSPWIIFGIETVLVLILCIITAYGLGSLFYFLYVVKHEA